MLVTAEEMLKKAKAGKYAVGQFNINNLEWTKAILATAQELQSPVILGVSEGAGKYMTGFGTVAAMVKAMIEEMNITVPVALHLDHGTYEGCYKCIKAGFSSIMFDGSHLPIEENTAVDAVFIGGHGGKLKEIIRKVVSHLDNRNGKIVFNSVSEESCNLFREAVKENGLKLHSEMNITVDSNNPITIFCATSKDHV